MQFTVFFLDWCPTLQFLTNETLRSNVKLANKMMVKQSLWSVKCLGFTSLATGQRDCAHPHSTAGHLQPSGRPASTQRTMWTAHLLQSLWTFFLVMILLFLCDWTDHICCSSFDNRLDVDAQLLLSGTLWREKERKKRNKLWRHAGWCRLFFSLFYQPVLVPSFSESVARNNNTLIQCNIEKCIIFQQKNSDITLPRVSTS